MPMLTRRAALLGTLAVPLAGALATPTHAAAAPVKIRFVLDWKYQGIHAPYLLAQKRGYFAREGLDVQIDQGNGSAATITSIMSGAYDAGVGDINAIIQNAGERPDQTPVMVYMLFNQPPFAMVVKASSPIKTLKDLEGRSIGSPAGGASVKLFPLLASRNGIDQSKISFTNVSPALQEQILVKDQVDAALVFNVTTYANLIGLGLDPDKDVRWFYYGQYGVDLYSNGTMVSQALLRDKPDAVRGLVRAVNQGVKDCIADPDAAIAVLSEVEPLIKPDVEKKRWLYALDTLVHSPEQEAIGLGDLKDDRLGKSIGEVTQAFTIAKPPTVAQVFNRSFLPPQADRTVSWKKG